MKTNEKIKTNETKSMHRLAKTNEESKWQQNRKKMYKHSRSSNDAQLKSFMNYNRIGLF